MMAALGFFLSLDPALETSEALRHFPLQGGFPRSYERLSPLWPPYEDWAIEQLKALPVASEREVTRRIVDNGRTVALAGCGAKTGWLRNGWWETLNDIARDVKRKYRYYVSTEAESVDLELADGRVVASARGENLLDFLPTYPDDLVRLHAQRDSLMDLHLQNRREPSTFP
jgi:hypothetical protein